MSNLGGRMKQYEEAWTSDYLMPLVPALARLDGRAFHTFCRGLAKPFDDRMISAMVYTARGLLEETHALLAYTQSDEITLVWHSTDIKSQIFMAGRVFKMQSTLASLASVLFYEEVSRVLPDKLRLRPTFDCRVWSVPNQAEACNALLWRERDATRNSILSAGQAHFSHKQLHNKNTRDIQEMLHGVGVNWNDYPARFKRGAYLRRTLRCIPFSTEEIARLPSKHEARSNPDLVVERRVTEELDMPPLSQVENASDVVFEGATPQLSGETSSED